MMDCLFCDVVHGKAASSIVYRDEQTCAFMNLRQANAGHVLVVPRSHVETIDQLDRETAAALFWTVVHVSRGIRTALQPDGLNIWQSNGAAAGQEIPHVHIHLLPRMANDNKIQFYTQLPPLEQRPYLDELADRIRCGLQS